MMAALKVLPYQPTRTPHGHEQRWQNPQAERDAISKQQTTTIYEAELACDTRPV